jgi:hypothetical protein
LPYPLYLLAPPSADFTSRPHKGSRQRSINYRYSLARCVIKWRRAGSPQVGREHTSFLRPCIFHMNMLNPDILLLDWYHKLCSIFFDLLPKLIFQIVQVIIILQKRYTYFASRISIDLLPTLMFQKEVLTLSLQKR